MTEKIISILERQLDEKNKQIFMLLDIIENISNRNSIKKKITISSDGYSIVLKNLRQPFKFPFKTMRFTIEKNICAATNHVRATVKDVIEWTESNNKLIKDSLRKEMERCGYWVKVDKFTYMVNPEIIHFSNRDQLMKIYKEKGGISVK